MGKEGFRGEDLTGTRMAAGKRRLSR